MFRIVSFHLNVLMILSARFFEWTSVKYRNSKQMFSRIISIKSSFLPPQAKNFVKLNREHYEAANGSLNSHKDHLLLRMLRNLLEKDLWTENINRTWIYREWVSIFSCAPERISWVRAHHREASHWRLLIKFEAIDRRTL